MSCSVCKVLLDENGNINEQPGFPAWPPVATDSIILEVLRFGEGLNHHLYQKGADQQLAEALKVYTSLNTLSLRLT